jgi:phosphatidylserine decarboxylase
MLRSAIKSVFLRGDINFLLSNRIPRRLATRFFRWFSRIEQPVVRDLSIAIWRRFADLDLSDARNQHFASLHECFIRRLKDDARPLDADPAVLVSPCDAIIGASGTVEDGRVLQIKGSSYPLIELLGDDLDPRRYRNGHYVTLRLTSSMYHRVHAPNDCFVDSVTYISGDIWNVNPVALRRVERLFCKNERVLIRAKLPLTGEHLTMVLVGAILVASIRLSFLGAELDVREGGSRKIHCGIPLRKGQEMGWFEHGSTVIVFGSNGFQLCDGVCDGAVIRVGQPLMRMPAGSGAWL